jgi:hypothetical protein
MATTVPELLQLRPRQLDALFAESEAGAIPVGDTHGTAIIGPGTALGGPLAAIARSLVWQGKVFDPARGELRNKLSPVGFKGVVAKVYTDASWLDGKEAIVLDYSKTSTIARAIRDEIRSVGDGTYLGLVFWGRKRLIHFALETTNGRPH